MWYNEDMKTKKTALAVLVATCVTALLVYFGAPQFIAQQGGEFAGDQVQRLQDNGSTEE